MCLIKYINLPTVDNQVRTTLYTYIDKNKANKRIRLWDGVEQNVNQVILEKDI